MEAPCVRVPREEGEQTRQRLAEGDLIDRRYRIESDDGSVYIPVSSPDVVAADYDIVERAVEVREEQILPRHLLDDPASYERLGDIALIDEDDTDRAREVAEALIESSLPIKTVLNRRSKIKGERRIRDWELLAGVETETVHREFGVEFQVDVTEVYFSPRLATERHRVVSDVDPDEHFFDMFAGVGPFVIPAAIRGAKGIGVDINERAIAYLERNAERNGVADHITAIRGDVRSVAPEFDGWADRIVMNLPHRANAFLETAGVLAANRCIIHYYDIQPDDDPFSPGITAIRETLGDRYEVDIREERIVRSYAPHEVNVCLDVDLEAR